MTKIIHHNVRETHDEQGNIKRRETDTTYNFGTEPEYVKLYLSSVLFLKSLPKGYNPILMAFLKRMSYAENGMRLILNAYTKREIADELDVSLSYISNSITDFVKGKILFRLGTGTYQFNPHIFGRGDWKDIAKIRATITFSPEGTDFETEITKLKSKKQSVPVPEVIRSTERNSDQITIVEAIERAEKEQSAAKAV